MDSHSSPIERSRSDLFLDEHCPTVEEVRLVLGAQSSSPIHALEKKNTGKRRRDRNGERLGKLERAQAEKSEASALREEVKRLQTMNAVLWNDNSRMHRIIMLNLSHNRCFRCQTNENDRRHDGV